MKTILIPTEDHDAMPAVLEAARLVARTFDGYMEGLAVHPAAGTYVAVEPVSVVIVASLGQLFGCVAACALSARFSIPRMRGYFWRVLVEVMDDFGP